MQAVDSAFEGAKVFFLSAQRPATNADLSVRNEVGQRVARSIDASAFLERLAQVQRNLPDR